MGLDRAEDDAPKPGEPEPLGPGLRKLRRARGLSQRRTAELLGLGSHGAVADYESGRRMPPNDILRSYERLFGLAPRQLQARRSAVLAFRAEFDYRSTVDRLAPAMAAEPDGPDEPLEAPAADDAEVTSRRGRNEGRPRRLWLLTSSTAVALVAIALLVWSQARGAGPRLDVTWGARTQHVSDQRLRDNAPENMDGDDPRARDCFADAVTVQTVPFTMPDHSPGVLVCGFPLVVLCRGDRSQPCSIVDRRSLRGG